jgi:hypothetical protein
MTDGKHTASRFSDRNTAFDLALPYSTDSGDLNQWCPSDIQMHRTQVQNCFIRLIDWHPAVHSTQVR